MYFSTMYNYVDIAGRSSAMGLYGEYLKTSGRENGDFQPLYAKISRKR